MLPLRKGSVALLLASEACCLVLCLWHCGWPLHSQTIGVLDSLFAWLQPLPLPDHFLRDWDGFEQVMLRLGTIVCRCRSTPSSALCWQLNQYRLSQHQCNPQNLPGTERFSHK